MTALTGKLQYYESLARKMGARGATMAPVDAAAKRMLALADVALRRASAQP